MAAESSTRPAPEPDGDVDTGPEALRQTTEEANATDLEDAPEPQEEGNAEPEDRANLSEEEGGLTTTAVSSESPEAAPPVAEQAAQIAAPAVLVQAAPTAEPVVQTDEGATSEGSSRPEGGTPWLRFLEGAGHGDAADHSGAEEGSHRAPEAQLAKGMAPAPPAETTSLDLLDVHEAMDPTFRIEATPNQVMGRLQQAMAADPTAAHLQELGEVVLPQVVRGLATLVRNDMAEMRIQLQPPDLGEIELRVRAVEGMVRGDITVQNQQIKYLLESQLDRLRAALEQHGLELEGLDVEVSQRGPFSGQDPWGRGDGTMPGNGSAANRMAPQADGDTAPADPRQLASPSGDTEIDYLA